MVMGNIPEVVIQYHTRAQLEGGTYNCRGDSP